MGKSKRIRVSEKERELIEELRGERVQNAENRFTLTDDEFNAVKEFRQNQIVRVSNNSKTETKDYSNPVFVLSAWNQENGKMMDIDTYCEEYSLPRKDITSYKLISHTGTPYYNIVFKENQEVNVSEFDFEGVIKSVADRVTPIRMDNRKLDSKLFTRLIYTDTHIGMDTNAEGTAMYATKWDYDAVMLSLDNICQNVIDNRQGDTLYIDELGDFLDGFSGNTTRGGHHLPQNMTNEEAFKTALEFKLGLLDRLTPYFNKIVCHNTSNDNHGGSFSAILNIAFKQLAEAKYPHNVKVVNIEEFIGHYVVGNHAFVLCHGKDRQFMKFGFKPQLDTKQIEKIDHYLKQKDVYRGAKFIEFSKGDSHQMLFDYSTAQDFDYFNYPALSPSSEWVMTNFKKGIRGFVIQQVSYELNEKKIIPIFL